MGIETKAAFRRSDTAFGRARSTSCLAASDSSHPLARHSRGGTPYRYCKAVCRYSSIAMKCSSQVDQPARGDADRERQLPGNRRSGNARLAHRSYNGAIPKSLGKGWDTRHAPTGRRGMPPEPQPPASNAPFGLAKYGRALQPSLARWTCRRGSDSAHWQVPFACMDARPDACERHTLFSIAWVRPQIIIVRVRII